MFCENKECKRHLPNLLTLWNQNLKERKAWEEYLKNNNK